MAGNVWFWFTCPFLVKTVFFTCPEDILRGESKTSGKGKGELLSLAALSIMVNGIKCYWNIYLDILKEKYSILSNLPTFIV